MLAGDLGAHADTMYCGDSPLSWSIFAPGTNDCEATNNAGMFGGLQAEGGREARLACHERDERAAEHAGAGRGGGECAGEEYGEDGLDRAEGGEGYHEHVRALETSVSEGMRSNIIPISYI